MASEQEPGLRLSLAELAGPLPVGGRWLRREAILRQLAGEAELPADWAPVLRRLQAEFAADAQDTCRQQGDPEDFERAWGVLRWSLEPVIALPAELQPDMRHGLAAHSSQVLGALHRMLLEGNGGGEGDSRRRWLAGAAELARWHRRCALHCPEWFGSVEEQLVRAAALEWLELARTGSSEPAIPLALDLLDQLGGLHQPCPDWIRLAQQELAAATTPIATTRNPASTPTATPGPATSASPNPKPTELRLELRPDEPDLIPDNGALVVNVAGRLESAAADQLGLWFESLLVPLRDASSGETSASPLRLREPESSLHRSLQSLWRQGQQVPQAWFRGLAVAADHWRRTGAELVAPWPDFPPAQLEPGCLLVRPGNVELAALRTALNQPAQQQSALGAIASRSHEQAWMETLRDDWWCDPSDATENLRRLHTNAGFYCDQDDPLGCLEAWRDGTVAALVRGRVLSGHITAWMAAVGQELALQKQVIPELVQWPGDGAWYHFIAGKQVLFVTPLAVDVQRHHNSGLAFDLYHDQVIAPYALRCVPAPMSIHPNRPDRGFRKSLERCLAAVDAAWHERPFEVFTAACGAYGLPLCAAVHERYGVACVYAGNIMHAHFGVLQQTTADWRAGSRRPENWITSRVLDGVAGLDRIEGGRYLSTAPDAGA